MWHENVSIQTISGLSPFCFHTGGMNANRKKVDGILGSAPQWVFFPLFGLNVTFFTCTGAPSCWNMFLPLSSSEGK